MRYLLFSWQQPLLTFPPNRYFILRQWTIPRSKLHFTFILILIRLIITCNSVSCAILNTIKLWPWRIPKLLLIHRLFRHRHQRIITRIVRWSNSWPRQIWIMMYALHATIQPAVIFTFRMIMRRGNWLRLFLTFIAYFWSWVTMLVYWKHF